jgi:predicted metal-dependent phosphoesterase TrpH
LRVDLHCHTRASDGDLTPAQLCERALKRDLQLLAITDHDTMLGWAEASAWLATQPAASAALRLLPAVEYSCVWQNLGVHVVGLDIDFHHPASVHAAAFLRQARALRAEQIGERLAKLGMPGAWAGASGLGGDSPLGRPHFARFLVQAGHVGNEDSAFDRYLGAGKVGDVKMHWPSLDEVVAWITAAGGVAVLAHPLKYRQTAARLRRLVEAFRSAGGGAIEVVVGRQNADDSRFMAQLCKQYALQASVGSDFHKPGPWTELGDIAALPAGCEPVWQRWQAAPRPDQSEVG